MIDREIEKLTDDLKTLKKPLLSVESKEKMKRNVLCGLQIFESVKSSLDIGTRARIKERIFMMIEEHSQKRFFFGNFFAFHKKLVSGVLMLALVFGTFGFLNVNTGVVRAATFTVVESYSGEVFVERDGEVVNVYSGMQLFENDAISTAENGRVVIEYFDDSVSRLSGETRVVLEKLARPDGSPVKSNVEVLVVRGTVWSKVLNLVESGSSFVVRANNVYASTKRAAFNVKVDEESFEIGVFKNSVEVKGEGNVEHVMTGKKLVISEDLSKNTEIKDVEISEAGDEWVRENLKYDRQYLSDVENRLLAARAEAMGIDIDDELSFDRSMQENALLFLTFDDVKTKKIELDLAEKNFIAAQIKLHGNNLSDEDRDAAMMAIDDFGEEVRAFYDFTDNIALTDEAYAEELQAEVSEMVMANKKDLSIVTPDSPIYLARNVVEDLELLQAKDDSEMAGLKLQHAVDKLVAVEDAVYDDVPGPSSEVIVEYMQNVGEALDLIEILDVKDEYSRVAKENLVAKASQDIDFLEATNVVTQVDLVKLRNDVTRIAKQDEVPVIEENIVVAPIVAVESTEISEEADVEVAEVETVVSGPFGVSILGDKPLSPLLEDVN